MDQQEQTRDNKSMGREHPTRHRVVLGLLIITGGLTWMLERMGYDILPNWIFSWPMILIILGLLNGVKHSFRNPGAYILLVIGGAFLVKNNFNIPAEISLIFWPLVVVSIGLIVLFRPRFRKKKDPHHRWNVDGHESFNGSGEFDSPKIDSVTIFSGSEKEVISKSFVGGDIVTLFGGSDLDLTRADIQGQATIDMVTIFGGAKLVVPPNWNVVINTTNVAGGVEDKRPRNYVDHDDAPKTLLITGAIIFGGLEIKSL